MIGMFGTENNLPIKGSLWYSISDSTEFTPANLSIKILEAILAHGK